MKLTLTYEGKLPPTQRGVSSEKASIRRQLHPQIKSQMMGRITDDTSKLITQNVGDYSFVSPVNAYLGLGVELDILLLTPRARRRSSIGDLDNRLKTLIDGLTRPANAQQLNGHAPLEDEPFTYCLLDDDSLVQRIGLESRVWHVQKDADYTLVVITATIVRSDDTEGEIKYATLPLLF